MGGMGTWAMIGKQPPVWAFHAGDDPVVPVTGSFGGLCRKTAADTCMMVSALGGTENRNVRYTEYPTGYMKDTARLNAHALWIPAYDNREALQ